MYETTTTGRPTTMLCARPIRVSQGEVPCGQCMNCRINRQRINTGKILMEELGRPTNEASGFWTLTYDDDHLPRLDCGRSTLVPDHLQAFLKKLRKGPAGSVRYYAAGEYGEKSGRAHYHLILFGIGPAWHDAITKAWSVDGQPRGFVYPGELTPQSAAYTAQYCTKGLTTPDRIGTGQYPEFARMSRRPALGYRFMLRVADYLTTATGAAQLAAAGIPQSFRLQGKIYPISRYWQRWLARRLDYDDTDETLFKGLIFDGEKALYLLRQEQARKSEAKRHYLAQARKARATI